MSPQQIRLVQETFEMVEPMAGTAAGLFYSRLFEIDPALRSMFRGDIEEQGKKLMQLLATAVKGLSELDQLAPAMESLGARHAAYGVREEHYSSVASALLWALERGLGPAFSVEVCDAWADVYQVLAGTMMRGARQALAAMDDRAVQESPEARNSTRNGITPVL